MGRARPHFSWRRGVGWGGVKYFKSNAKVSLAHSHPPSHIIRNTKENQLLLRRLPRICVYIYIYANISPHFPIYCHIFLYVFQQVPVFGSYICCHMLLNVSQYCLILSYIFFPYVLIFLLYIPRDFPIQNVQIGSNIFGSREHGIIIPIGIPYGAFFSLWSLFFSPVGGAAMIWAAKVPRRHMLGHAIPTGCCSKNSRVGRRSVTVGIKGIAAEGVCIYMQ